MKSLKRWIPIFFLLGLLLTTQTGSSQCSICTKTAQQMGHKPAKALNAGIIYLMLAPLAIMGVVGLRWWKNNGRS
jgi:hypothetical protein